jgi:hypothetical protein
MADFGGVPLSSGTFEMAGKVETGAGKSESQCRHETKLKGTTTSFLLYSACTRLCTIQQLTRVEVIPELTL